MYVNVHCIVNPNSSAVVLPPQILHVTIAERDVYRGKVLRFEKEVLKKVSLLCTFTRQHWIVCAYVHVYVCGSDC